MRRRVERFDLDVDAYPGYFVEVLARENDWTHGFAERVVVEYRRYAFLACTAEHVVVPSEEVDMAWHQHLLDTEQYWGHFCREVLNRPLHHRPNKGGSNGQSEHLELYRRTLQTYATTFGSEPPGDVWPPPERRFGSDPSRRRNTILDIGIRRRAHVIGVTVALALALPATVAWAVPATGVPAALGLGDLGWSDATASIVLAVASVIAVLASYGLRRALLGSASPTTADVMGHRVDVYDAAVLNTDTKVAVNVSVAALVHDEAPESSRPKYRLVRTGRLPIHAHPLERATYEAVPAARSISFAEVHARVRPEALRILEALRERQLLRDPNPYVGRRVAVVLPILVVVVGLTALSTAGSVTAGFILLGAIVLVIAALVLSVAPSQLTDLGRSALDAADQEHPAVFPVYDEDVADGRTLSWIIALQGTPVLRGATLSAIRAAINASADEGGGGQGVRRAGCGGGRQRVGESSGSGLGGLSGGSGGGGCGSGCGGN